MKPTFQNSLIRQYSFANIVVGVIVLNSSAMAGDVFWDGSTDNNWNTADNWSANRVPSKSFDQDNAIINSLTNFPVITADLSTTPRDIKVGTVSGPTAQLDHRAGSVTAGSDALGRDWVVIGEDAGNGIYNLADTSAGGGTLTSFGTGSGSLTAQRLYVARKFSTNVPTGEMAVNTTGTVKVFNDMYIGDGGIGTLNWDAGTLERNGDGGWMVVGQGGASGNGTFNISGGTINAASDTNVGKDVGSTGSLTLSGGTYNAGGIWAGRDGGTGTWTVSGENTQLTSSGEVYVGGNAGSIGTFQINSGTVALNNWVNVGRDGGTGTLEMTGGALSVERALRIGFGSGGTGTLTLSGGAQVNAATVSEVVVIGGDKGNGTATVTGTGTLLKSAGEFYVGNDDDSVGELTVSGGTVESGSWFGIGRNGSTGTLTINGTGVVIQGSSDLGSRLEMTNNSKPTSATIHLDGGTLSTNGINSGSNGSLNIFLNGGILQARVNNLTFLEGMSSVTVKSGGAKIDTNGVSATINQSMIGEGIDGGLTKLGPGTLRLNGTNTFTGTTIVNEGSIAGSGSVAGALILQTGTTISPGPPSSGIGTFSARDTTIAGTYSCGVNGPSSDLIRVTGALNLASTTDAITFVVPGDGATLPVYIIASYTSLTGTFNTVNGLPSGYSINYNYNGSTQIAITRPLTPYENWLTTFLPGETDPAIIGMEADPDDDNQPNKLEFALGSDPDDAGDTAKIYPLTEDSSDAGTAKELLLTIAVRDGAGIDPVFAPATGGNPTASQDGVTYTIQGGIDLSSFTGTVSVVNTVSTGLPPAPTGYEYRTFSLDGSDGLPSKGFMRVSITP